MMRGEKFTNFEPSEEDKIRKLDGVTDDKLFELFAKDKEDVADLRVSQKKARENKIQDIKQGNVPVPRDDIWEHFESAPELESEPKGSAYRPTKHSTDTGATSKEHTDIAQGASPRRALLSDDTHDLHKLRGSSLESITDYLEGSEPIPSFESEQPHGIEALELESTSVFDGFLKLLRDRGIKVSTPEWLHFLQVVEGKTKPDELGKVILNNELLKKIRLFAKVTLIKNKADEAAFHEVFDEYFQGAIKVFNYEVEKQAQEEAKKQTPLDMQKPEKEQNEVEPEKEGADSGVEPDMKEQLGIKEVDENLNAQDDKPHDDNEQVHGGKKDQHNDILKKADLSKKGGGNKKEGKQGEGDKGEASEGKGDKGEPSGKGRGSSGLQSENVSENSAPPMHAQGEQKELSETGFLVGGGKGKSITAVRVNEQPIIHEGEKLTKQAIAERKEKMGRVDRRSRYEVRPDRASMREVIRNIRRIILDVSEMKSKNINIGKSVRNFAKRDFRFEYEREREKQPEIVLFIDVGGPVDEWSPLMKEVTESMAEGLTKLEIYLFHNNLYGYVWKPDPKDLLRSSYAKPNSLIDVRTVVKKRKKVIIYGDAEMSSSEFEYDGWPPSDNDDRVKRFGMDGPECLDYIKKHSDATVWINPVFKKEWSDRDDSGTIHEAGDIIPMYDLTIGGVEDSIKKLMKK